MAQQSWEKLHFVTHTHKRSLTAHSRLPAESPPPPRPKWTHTGRLSSLQWRIIGPRHFGKYLNSTLFPQRLLSRPSPATSHSTASDSPEMSCKNRCHHPLKADFTAAQPADLISAVSLLLRTRSVYVEIKTLAVASSKEGESRQR